MENNSYQIFRNSLGVVDAINRSLDGVSLPYDSGTKQFDEESPLVIELREWEAENGKLDLATYPEPLPPLEQIRQQKIEQITQEAAYRQDALVSGYASAERDSWDKKIEQSEKFLLTKDLKDAKYLKTEAIAMTGFLQEEQLLPAVEMLATKILGKADELLGKSATIAGKRTRLISIVSKSEDINLIQSLNFDAEV